MGKGQKKSRKQVSSGVKEAIVRAKKVTLNEKIVPKSIRITRSVISQPQTSVASALVENGHHSKEVKKSQNIDGSVCWRKRSSRDAVTASTANFKRITRSSAKQDSTPVTPTVMEIGGSSGSTNPNQHMVMPPISKCIIRSSAKHDSTPVTSTAVSKAKESKSSKGTSQVSEVDFAIGDIVWGKIRGFCQWPAKIVEFSKGKVTIWWYKDYRYSSVFKSQICKFSEHCLTFSKKSQSSPALQAAIKEALIDLKMQRS